MIKKRKVRTNEQLNAKGLMKSFCSVTYVGINVKRKVISKSTSRVSMSSTLKYSSARNAGRS